MSNKKLIHFVRSGIVETEHCGCICHCSKSKILHKINFDKKQRFFLRSCMKPLQASILVDFDLINYFNFSIEEIAISTASHTGEKQHIELVKSILNKINLSEKELLCPIEHPLSESAKQELILNNTTPTKLHSNCSGKHAMMLAACVKNGWETTNYNDFTHPLQKYILSKIAQFAQISEDKIPVSLDGCGLPVYALTLEELAKSFINLFDNSKYELIRKAFITYPYLIGGHNRTDSEIIESSEGKLIAKVGAGGLICIFNNENKEAVAIKIDDANMKAREIVTIEYLKKIGWLNKESIPEYLGNTSIKTAEGKILGNAICTF